MVTVSDFTPQTTRRSFSAILPLVVFWLVSCIWSLVVIRDSFGFGIVVLAFSPSSRIQHPKILARLGSRLTRRRSSSSSSIALRMSMVNRTEVSPSPLLTATRRTEDSEARANFLSSPTIARTLLQRRLHERYSLPLSDAILVEDCEYDEEKKEDTGCYGAVIQGKGKVIVEVKTLVWEVQAVIADDFNGGTATPATKSAAPTTFYVVTALQMKDKIEMRKLKDLVLEKTSHHRALKSIRSMQLAPLKVAESLTGFQSGCMPPICHTQTDMDLYVDRSIWEIYKSQTMEPTNEDDANNAFASIGSGIPGKSLVLPLRQFLRVAGAELEEENQSANHSAATGGTGFIGSISTATSSLPPSIESTMSVSTEAAELSEGKIDHQPRSQQSTNSNEFKMMSGIELRKFKQEERKQQREAKKDRLQEYRSFRKDDILSKAKLFRTTARKKGRIPEMEELIQEALSVGDFPKLMEIPDEQNPNTNIDKNALHICAWRGDFETVVRLVEISTQHYPQLDVVNMISKGPGNYGKTPIFFALTQCREDVVRYLVEEAGADLLIVNNKGQTPCSIARSHVSEETCNLLYETERKQLEDKRRSTAGEGTPLFANHREGIHSDHKLYGDLDPRFPIDDDNRYFNEASRKSEEEKVKRRSKSKNEGYDPKVFLSNYMDRTDDLTDQIQEYEESVRLAPEESKINGIPTQFSPRSLRPTVRWWNRDDRSLAKANDDTSLGGQITFTQSRPRSKKAQTEETKNEELTSREDGKVSRFSEVDIDSLELISIDDVIEDDSRIEDNKILVDNAQSLGLFEEEVDRLVSELDQDQKSGVDDDEAILMKYAWGIDCEWKPGPDCGEDSPVSTLQLGTRRKAFLIDLQTICRSQENLDFDDSLEKQLNRILLKLFRNPSISLVGYGVLQDLGKLASSFPHLTCFLEFVSVLDLQSIVSTLYNTKFDRKAMSSLQKVTAVLLNKRLEKTQQVSDWSHRPLSEEQVSYAMLDAAIIPLLLSALFQKNALIESYNGRFFNVHNNLISTIRFTSVEPCKEGYVYQIAYGSIKSTLGKAFARQSWPTKMKLEPPEPPKLVEVQQIPNGDSSTPKISKKERAHLRKIGADEAGNIPKRPKPIPLKTLSGNLDNLPIPGITLGYTKESCAFRVVGHELFKTIPEGTYIGFNRRAGVVETSNAWILFCNFGGDKVFSEFFDNGRKLTFRVNSNSQKGRSSEASLYRQMVSSSSQLSTKDSGDRKPILLFARESTRMKYLYCGVCSCNDVITLDKHTAALMLQLDDYDEILWTSTGFQDLVAISQS